MKVVLWGRRDVTFLTSRLYWAQYDGSSFPLRRMPGDQALAGKWVGLGWGVGAVSCAWKGNLAWRNSSCLGSGQEVRPLVSANTLEQYHCHHVSHWSWASRRVLVRNTSSLAPLLRSGLWPGNQDFFLASKWIFWSGKYGTQCPKSWGLLQGWTEADIEVTYWPCFREDVQKKSNRKASLGEKTVYHLTENSKRRTRLSMGSTSLFINQYSNLSELLRQHRFISNCTICYPGKTDKS